MQVEERLKAEFLRMQEAKAPKKSEKKELKPRGRPKRIGRPERSAGKRTEPGEERYTITLRVEHIAAMKKIAESVGLSIKDAFADAINDYIGKNRFKSE